MLFVRPRQSSPTRSHIQNVTANGRGLSTGLGKSRQVLIMLVALGVVGFNTHLLQGQTSSHVDSKISGYWELRPDSLNVPPAPLLPAARERLAQEYQKTQYARRWCNPVGVPEDMVSYRPISIVVGEKEVAMPSEFTTSPRHIYLDRTAHNNPDIYEPIPTGDSIGRWDGDDLLVETTGLAEKGVTELPGGGFRTKDSVLAERYHVLNDGANLEVTFTWYDPAVFSKPFTYSFYYYRLATPPNHEPYSIGEVPCVASSFEPTRDEVLLKEPKPVPRPENKN
jgi:hypothetical protein